MTDAGILVTNNTAGFFPAFAVNPTPVFDSGLFQSEIMLGTNRVYLTRTSSNSWDPISPVLSNNGGLVSALSFTPQAGAYYAATNLGEVFFTANAGADLWPERDAGLPHVPISSITVDPSNFKIAYVTFDGGVAPVWMTTNAGLTWKSISGSLPSVGGHDLAIDINPGLGAPHGKLYVALDTGVYFSNNGGESWQPLGSGLPNVPASDLQFNAQQHLLAVATLGRGAFSLSTAALSPIANVTAPEDLPLHPIPFTINENGIADSKISISASSSNQALIGNQFIFITGSGPDRTLLIFPNPYHFGSTTITLTVSDGANTFTSSFVVNIPFTNHPPTISTVPNQSVAPGTTVGPLAFTVADVPTETPADQLVVTAHSSNQAVVPDANIVLGGSVANRTVTVTPGTGTVLGATTITLTVADSDGGVTPTSFAVLFTSPVTLPFADNFNRPDNLFLGPGWVQNLGDLKNASNAALGTTATDVATLQGVSNSDVKAQADVLLASTGVQFAGLVARYNGPGDTNMYWGALVDLNGKFEADIFRNVGGVWSELASTPVTSGAGTLSFTSNAKFDPAMSGYAFYTLDGATTVLVTTFSCTTGCVTVRV